MNTEYYHRGRHGQRGAALVISLVLLLVMTIFGIAGMSTSTLELVMAGNMQYQNSAFEAAESIVEAELRRNDIVPQDVAGALPLIAANTNREFRDPNNQVVATASSSTDYVASTGAAGWQLGGAVSFSAFHFESNGTSTSAQAATADHRQGYYVVGPSL